VLLHPSKTLNKFDTNCYRNTNWSVINYLLVVMNKKPNKFDPNQ
jgi:hypothetical protein